MTTVAREGNLRNALVRGMGGRGRERPIDGRLGWYLPGYSANIGLE